MKIYFDNVLINEDYYKSLTNTHNLFNGNFILGSTASNTFTLELDVLATSTTPEVIKITDNDEDYATLVIDKVEDVDKYTKSYKLTDKLVDLNYYYDASEFINQNGGSALTSEILADMCSKIGLEVDENINWINDIPVTWYDNTILAREYAGYIAEINAGYIFILPNGKLTIKQHKMTSKYTINVDDCENFTLGERHIISKVVYDNGIVKYEAGDDTGNTLYVDTNNVFIVSQEQVTNIYNAIVGFEFYSVETGNCPINKDVRAGDVITFVDGDNEYPTIANIDLSYNGGWNGGYSLNINTERQEETDLIGNNTKIRGIVSRLNRDEAKLEVIATQTDDNTEEIGNLQVGFDEVKTEVSKVTNLIKETQSNNNLIIEDASANDLKSLSIKGQISLLFGNDGKTYGIVPLAEILYPSNTLFGKNMNLIVEGTEETQTIKLPFTFLNYINNEICDEFLLQDGKASVIRRVGINSNMEKYQLETEVIEDLGELNIALFDSYNKLYLQCFDNAILNASYMVKNEFTDNFVTHSEFNAGLDITSTSIKQEVNAQFEGVDGEIQEINGSLELKLDKNDNDQIVSMLNASADVINIEGNRFVVKSNNFKTTEDGTTTTTNMIAKNINVEDGTFSGTITGGLLESPNYNSGSGLSINLNNGSIIANEGISFGGTGYFRTYVASNGDLFANKITVRNDLDGSDFITMYQTDMNVYGNLYVSGSKNRMVKTNDYGIRLLNAYETTTPYFGDIGSNITDSNGYCKIEIEDIFKETIELDNYKVFIQECSEGHLYVKKYDEYFEVHGTPNLEFDWEIKAIQKGYKDIRLKEKVRESESDINE